MSEKNYERVNWQARKTPLSAENFNRMDEGIAINRSAIQELQSAVFEDGKNITYQIEKVVTTRYELPNIPVNGAYYYVSSTNSIYQGVNAHYELVRGTIKQINGGGAI